MPNIRADSHERHASQRWLRYSNYLFAEQDAVVATAALSY